MSSRNNRRPPGGADQLGPYIKEQLRKQHVTQQVAAVSMGIGVSHLSELIHGKRMASARMCVLLADYLNVPRVVVFKKAGWLEMDGQDTLIDICRELIRDDRFFRRLVSYYSELGNEEERRKFIRLVEALLGDKPDFQ
jgi:transcriptional regulator with XRE-family HTH domain